MASIKLQFTGFEEMIQKLEKAGQKAEPVVLEIMKKSADIQQQELKKAMQATDVASDLIERMPPPKVEMQSGLCRAEVGYEKGAYNPKDIDDGYKAIFINFGTPRIKPRNFIKIAKNKAKPQINKVQEEAFQRIMGGIE